MLHQHCHHHVDQDELCDEDEGDEVDGRDDGQVAEAVLVFPSALPEGILQQGASGEGLMKSGTPNTETTKDDQKKHIIT